MYLCLLDGVAALSCSPPATVCKLCWRVRLLRSERELVLDLVVFSSMMNSTTKESTFGELSWPTENLGDTSTEAIEVRADHAISSPPTRTRMPTIAFRRFGQLHKEKKGSWAATAVQRTYRGYRARQVQSCRAKARNTCEEGNKHERLSSTRVLFWAAEYVADAVAEQRSRAYTYGRDCNGRTVAVCCCVDQGRGCTHLACLVRELSVTTHDLFPTRAVEVLAANVPM